MFDFVRHLTPATLAALAHDLEVVERRSPAEDTLLDLAVKALAAIVGDEEAHALIAASY